KKILITQSNYIPWKGYFDAVNAVDEFVIYDDMQYTRRDWRNRNQIKTPQGLQWLSVPVEVKGKYDQKIKDTRVSDKGWARDHWKTIAFNYAKAAHFKEMKEPFEHLYNTIDFDFLSDVNFAFMQLVNSVLGIRTPMKWSSEFELKEERTERLVDICVKEQATDYYSGPAAKAYMNEEAFRAQNINVHYFDYAGYPPYRQLFGEFTHAVSILDLIFNEGPDAKNFMKSFKP
ncbi:MAG TPA: WbqC family protein, partial [Chitinophagales bacterium]|nr:WbqC family protein [Chitinophagales bacterium]